LLTGAIVAPVGPPVDRGTVLLFVVAIFCCFGRAATFAAVVVGFVVAVCCGGGDDDNTADVGGGVADDDNKDGFTVFGIPHIFDSVVLTALRLGLPGLHIFALSSGDIVVVLSELLLPAAGRGDDGGNCCAYTCILLQIPKSNMPTRTENTAKIEPVLLILHYTDAILLFILTNYKLSNFLYCYHADINARKRIMINYCLFLSYTIRQ
jgi:hypothetical protein